MKNLFLLPTDKLTSLVSVVQETSKDEFKRFYYIKSLNDIYDGKLVIPQHYNIYITSSDEEIKDCYALTDLDKMVKVDKSNQELYHRFNCKKIILTTDQDLIKDGIQAIPDEFLEWFVNNSSCEFVEVEPTLKAFDEQHRKIEYAMEKGDYTKNTYKIIIPKEKSNYKVKNTMFNCGDNEPADRLLTMLQSQGVLSESFVNKITKPIMICTTNFKGNEELINNLINQLDQEMKWLNLFSDSFRNMVTTELKLMVLREKQIEHVENQ